MRSQLLLVGVIFSTSLVSAGIVQARINPLRGITERLLRSEIVIVLDTSGSMAWHPSPAHTVGTDCGGDRSGTVDLCGDGICSGAEGSSGNRCSEDCNIDSNTTSTAGSPPVCNPKHSLRSRMFMVKRVLRNLLPGLRNSASLGLVTFKQRGYFRYYRAKKGTSRQVSMFLSKSEMEHLGAWDTRGKKPRSSFLRSGTTYTLLSDAGMRVRLDSLYTRRDDLSLEKRFQWSRTGKVHTDGQYTWIYQGSYYTYRQRPVSTRRPKLFDTYQGPQFTDNSGTTWIHNRFNHQYTSQGIDASSSGEVMEPLPSEPTQAAHDVALFNILARLNTASNGGLHAWGGTPTGHAINTAEHHFLSRLHGNGNSKGGRDPAAACRPRYVLLLTDGQSNKGLKPYFAVQRMYRRHEFAGNPVKTLVVGLPGLPSGAVDELDRTADMGDDGVANYSRSANIATDENSLVRVIKEALLEMVQGDYSTSSSGITTSSDSMVVGNLALVPSTSFPGWKGHLRAKDLTKEHMQQWDAGKLLTNRSHSSRLIFTGYPDSDNGMPVPLFSRTGKVNLAGGCEGCGGNGLRNVWRQAGTPPSDDEIRTVVQWLAGKDRAWKLGPILRSVPATVGPPPTNRLPGHDRFHRKYADRERLAYLTSNDGLLHAFRVQDGSEAFAYVPPNLWPKIYELWKQGGQDTDPANFKWILASSPRTMDIPPPSSGSGDWTTQLMLTMGPGDKAFVVLDVTNPSSCTALKCETHERPFKVLVHSRDLALNSVMGETWSVPTFFYNRDSSGKLQAQMAMGGGYGSGLQGNYYLHFSSLYSNHRSALHGPRSGDDVALLADPASVVDRTDEMKIIATYQADLSGRIVRYGAGETSQDVAVLSAGNDSPFYYSPAVRLLDDGSVLLAAASGSMEEETPLTTAESRIYLRAETNGDTSTFNHRLSCKVSEICDGGAGCPSEMPSSCAAPSSRALPVGPPIIINNKIAEKTYQNEVFFLYYDSPASVCSTGTTWLIRMATSAKGQKILSTHKYTSTRATGMTLTGGGQDIAITRSGLGKEEATLFSVLGNIFGTLGQKPMVETRRVVNATGPCRMTTTQNAQ